MSKISAQVKINRHKNAEYMKSLKQRPCADCNIEYPPYVMDFDHVRGAKLFRLAEATRTNISRKRIKEEVDKCDVVCANCHRERTHKRKIG